MLSKLYAPGREEVRDNSAESVGIERKAIMSNPDPNMSLQAYVERQNLSMRMAIRRLTRVTNGFSKKVENHAYKVAFYSMHYNFAPVHQTLWVAPAMQAGIRDRAWNADFMSLRFTICHENSLDCDNPFISNRGIGYFRGSASNPCGDLNRSV